LAISPSSYVMLQYAGLVVKRYYSISSMGTDIQFVDITHIAE